jgi:hypothetical protein
MTTLGAGFNRLRLLFRAGILGMSFRNRYGDAVGFLRPVGMSIPCMIPCMFVHWLTGRLLLES